MYCAGEGVTGNTYDDIQKLADLKDRGVLTVEEFEQQKSKLLHGDESKGTSDATISEKSRLVAFLLCFFLGGFGAHRFYVGKIGTAIVQLLTLGGFGIWTFIDMILILVGNFKDKDGKPVKNWNDD